jgi:dienelactone hydrolase
MISKGGYQGCHLSATPGVSSSTMLRGLWLCAALGLPALGLELPNFKSHFDPPVYRTRAEWETRRAQVRQQLLAAAGLLPMPARTPLRPRVVRRIDFPDYAIETVLIESLPGYFLGGNLYRPAGAKRNLPAVLAPHGHWKRGRLEDLPSYSVPALAINLARQGYVVFAYDMVGYNDTRQTPHSFSSPQHALWSFHPMGLQLWNSIRALDYLQSLPEVNPQRIGVTGASGGGSQTFFLTAVDDRVRVAAPVNMVSAYMQGGDPCEEAPNLRLDLVSNVEIAALAAPRPMMVVSSTHDWTRHTPVEEYPAIRAIYALYGRARDVENAHIDAEHNYNRESRAAVYRFLWQHLVPGRPLGEWVEKPYRVPRDEEMLALPQGPPVGAEGLEEVFQAWKVASRLQTEESAAPADLREALRTTLGAEWPDSTLSNVEGPRMTLRRKGRQEQIAAWWRPGKGEPVLIVHPHGSAAGLRSEAAAEALRSGRPVLLIDPSHPEAGRIPDRYFLSYNRSGDASRIQEIVTSLAFLHHEARGRVEMIGLGDAGVWCLFAAAIAPVRVELVADLNGFSGSDEDFRRRLFVPGIQRAGGLNAALRLVNSLRAAITTRGLVTAGE